MSKNTEPTPPARRDEDFPKTSTIPEGWVMDCLMEKYNETGMAYDRGVTNFEARDVIPVPATGGHTNGKTNGKCPQVEAQGDPGDETEGLFARRLEPFQSVYDQSGMWL